MGRVKARLQAAGLISEDPRSTDAYKTGAAPFECAELLR